MIITAWDFLLFPLYFFALFILVWVYSKKYHGTPLRRYFLLMFLLHAAGSFIHSLVLQYYYGFGDGFTYFQGGNFIKSLVLTPGEGPGWLLAGGTELFDHESSSMLDNYALHSLLTDSSRTMMKFSGIFSLLSGSTFMVNALFCGFLSFIGVWKLFLTFNADTEKKVEKPLALLLIWTPTIWFWGSSMGKDAVSIALIGLIVNSFYKVVSKKGSLIKHAMIILPAALILNDLKSAALATVAVAAAGYVVVKMMNAVRNPVFKFLISASFVSAILIGLFLSLPKIEDSLAEIESMVRSNAEFYAMENEGSGGFEAPDFDLSPAGIILAAPGIVFTTLFKPFIWEVRNPMMLLSAAESLAMFFGLFYAMLKAGILRTAKLIFKLPMLMYAVIFCVIFAMLIGFTTFNSGTLVRYRVLLLPFFIYFILHLILSARYKKTRAYVFTDATVSR